MNRPLCDRASLVEAMFDGRLGPSDGASTERHLLTCIPCAELARELTSLQQRLRSSASPILPLEHQRARLALLRRAAGASSAKRRPSALLVAVVLTLPVAAWAAVSPLSPLRLVDKTSQALAPSAPVTDTGRRRHTRQPPRASEVYVPTPATDTAVPAPRPPSEVSSTPAQRELARATPSVSSSRASSRKQLHREATARAASGASAAQDFAGAMNALSRGDFSASAKQFESFASAHPADPRVEDALYLEAIALERAGRISDAKVAAGHYLALYAHGVHRTHARRIAGD